MGRVITIIFLLSFSLALGAQTTKEYEFQKPPNEGETQIGIITTTVDAGEFDKSGANKINTLREYTVEQLIEILQEKADKKYKQDYPRYALRNFKCVGRIENRGSLSFASKYDVSAIVVLPDPTLYANENLSSVLEKAFRNVRQGSRIAIDQVVVGNGMNREDYQDQIIDMLLDMGYKVVAKEYLEKLYKEQQEQQSGVFNEQTTVQENNFSAVGYFMNVKATDTSLRVQVVNVSTGEYEGNATIKF